MSREQAHGELAQVAAELERTLSRVACSPNSSSHLSTYAIRSMSL